MIEPEFLPDAMTAHIDAAYGYVQQTGDILSRKVDPQQRTNLKFDTRQGGTTRHKIIDKGLMQLCKHDLEIRQRILFGIARKFF